MKNFFLVVIGMVIMALPAVYSHFMLSQNDSMISGNLEALTSGDPDFQCIYNRDDTGTCPLTVGAGVKVKECGLGILTANVEGYINLPGKVVCLSDGNKLCRPIECLDVYKEVSIESIAD